MEITKDLLSKIKENDAFHLEELVAKPQLTEIFHHEHSYIYDLKLFVILFNRIPNIISQRDINCTKAMAWFEENYISEIKDLYFSKQPYNTNKYKAEIEDVFYFLDEDLLVVFDSLVNRVYFLFKKTNIEKVEKIIEGVSKFKVRKEREKPVISLLVNSRKGLSTKSLDITKPKLSIEDNYNDDFLEIHQTILKRLRKNKDKGLVLLHGKPGTGKTSYIRYLISSVKKEVIFLPPNMASAITNPDLLGVLIRNPNSIFVIEDAENIVIDRERNGASPVSALLNLSDGLLSDCLNIQIICSFNTDLSRVDSALMRKGRLIAKYEFKELETRKAQALSDKLGFTTEIHSPMTLTDIYNQEEKSFQRETRRVIGF